MPRDGMETHTMKYPMAFLALFGLIGTAVAALPADSSALRGHYLESRTCDVYTGSCFANAEMGQTGKEAIMVWQVNEGTFEGVDLGGLSVVAVLRTQSTLGNVQYELHRANTVLVVDAHANTAQREALIALAKERAGGLMGEVSAVLSAPIEAKLGTCDGSGCATVKAGDLVEIKTRCLGNKDHVCGNEVTFYPPLTEVNGAYPVYTELAAYRGGHLGLTWEAVNTRSAFLASFTR
jgi:hypothetical protein